MQLIAESYFNWNEVPLPFKLMFLFLMFYFTFIRPREEKEKAALEEKLKKEKEELSKALKESKRINNSNIQIACCPDCGGKNHYFKNASIKSSLGSRVKYCQECNVEFVPKAYFD